MGRVTVQWQGPSWLPETTRIAGGYVYDRATTLTLTGPNYDDSAIEHLVKLKGLKRISLSRTRFTKEGLAKLRRALPDCQVQWSWT